MDCANFQSQQNCISYIAAGASAEVLVAPTSAPCPELRKYLIKLDAIQFDGRVFELKDPIRLTLYQDEDGQWSCEYEACDILSAGETAAEAVRSFSEDFSVLWDEIAQCPDDSLSEEAQALKGCLLSVVKSVNQR